MRPNVGAFEATENQVLQLQIDQGYEKGRNRRRLGYRAKPKGRPELVTF